jgi:hypothetical protein
MNLRIIFYKNIKLVNFNIQQNQNKEKHFAKQLKH